MDVFFVFLLVVPHVSFLLHVIKHHQDVGHVVLIVRLVMKTPALSAISAMESMLILEELVNFVLNMAIAWNATLRISTFAQNATQGLE